MKNAITNYENTFYLGGAALSGILSVEGSYSVEYKPINVIGKGFAKQVISSVPEANLSISRYLTNNDPAFNLTGDGRIYLAKPINGGLYYQNKYFGFQNGYLNSLGIQCSVGDVPQVQTSFNVYGDIGNNFNPSGQKYAGGVFVPQVKNIVLTCRNSTTNRIKNFNLDFSTPKSAIYGILENNAELPIEVHNVYPIEVKSSFTLEIDDYETKRAFYDLTSDGTTDFKISISGTVLSDEVLTTYDGVELTTSTGSPLQNFVVYSIEEPVPIFNFETYDAIIVSEQVNSVSNDVLSVNLSYKAYLN